MKQEREIAELIFDVFRSAKGKSGEIVMYRNLTTNLINRLNPKEKELFYTVLDGLVFTGYFTYEYINIECFRLTEKGYDYIYDDAKVAEMLQKPWVIPQVDKTDWDRAYNRLWKVIGAEDTAIHYISGAQFYKFVLSLCDDIPPSYTLFIEQRRKNNLSTSRVDYYNDLINHLEEEKRIDLYANIQLFLEENTAAKNRTSNDFNFDTAFISTDAISEDSEVELVHQESEAIAGNQSEKAPVVFISYSWDSEEHQDWVINLASKLRKNGVDVILDVWDIGGLGKLLPSFMENAITKSERVICVMTPNYKKKTEKLAGGVGFEYSIISAEIFTNGANTSKFIPLCRYGSDAEAIPTVLNSRMYVDMRDDSQFEEMFIELLRDIHVEPKHKKPVVGPRPKFD